MIGGPLHLCTDCTPHHYDNCPTCFGYGVRAQSCDGRPAPVGSAAARDPKDTEWLPCPTCGSTPAGPPEAKP